MTDVLLTSDLGSAIADMQAHLQDTGFNVLIGEPNQPWSGVDCVVTSPSSFLANQPQAQKKAPLQLPVVLVTSTATVQEAVHCMQTGASDYLQLDLQPHELAAAIERAVQAQALVSANTPAPPESFAMVGESPPMQRLRDQITKVADTDATALILGESGTGKELVARALHGASNRRLRPLITLNCASVPGNLVETELFGSIDNNAQVQHGLLQAADGGTLFLDEVAELPLEAQVRLIQVLEEGMVRPVGSTNRQSIDVRLIAATHRPLDTLTQTGKFRPDLYYRLSVFTLQSPALRDRGDDILRLAESFLAKSASRLNRGELRFSPDAQRVMLAYRWPGNVRELANAVERAVILCSGTEISSAELAVESSPPQTNIEPGAAPDQTTLEDYFVKFVTEHQDQLTETQLAGRLGISRKSLWERRQRLDIPRKKTKKRGPRREGI